MVGRVRHEMPDSAVMEAVAEVGGICSQRGDHQRHPLDPKPTQLLGRGLAVQAALDHPPEQLVSVAREPFTLGTETFYFHRHQARHVQDRKGVEPGNRGLRNDQ